MTGQRSERIAYIVSRFPKTTETFILYEVLELQSQGAKVTVHPLLPRGHELAHPGSADIPVVYPRAWPMLAAQAYWLTRSPGRYARAWFRAVAGNWRSWKFSIRAPYVMLMAAWYARIFVSQHVDHVHAHWATFPALAAYLVNRLTDVPFSFTAHAHDLFVDTTMLSEKMEAADFVVTISEYNRKMMEAHSRRTRIAVIGCGIDLEVFRVAPRPTHETPQRNRPLRLITVASLQPQKGHRFALEALRGLIDAGVQASYDVVGDGEEGAAVAAQVDRLGLGRHVPLLGAQSRDRVVELLAGADVYLQPSVPLASGKQEGIPVAIMEAMAMQLPVVATRISGIPELVVDGRSGIVVPPGDVAALVSAITRLANDASLRQQLGVAASVEVRRKHDLPTNVRRLRELIVSRRAPSETSPIAPSDEQHQRHDEQQKDRNEDSLDAVRHEVGAKHQDDECPEYAADERHHDQ